MCLGFPALMQLWNAMVPEAMVRVDVPETLDSSTKPQPPAGAAGVGPASKKPRLEGVNDGSPSMASTGQSPVSHGLPGP